MEREAKLSSKLRKEREPNHGRRRLRIALHHTNRHSHFHTQPKDCLSFGIARTLSNRFSAMASGGMGAAKGMTALFQRGNMASAMRLRAGFGLPVGVMESPSSPLPENAELIWDDGSAFPEPCLDNIAPMVGKYEALAWTMAGLGLFAGIAGLTAWSDKASRVPFAPREYPYDDLRVELGKEPQPT